jgi:hypothetical protein
MAKDEEAAELARWCLGVTQYFSKLGSNPIVPEIEEAIAKALKTRNLRNLKSIKRDLAEWGRGLNPEQRNGLEESIRAHVGDRWRDESALAQDAVRQILERGAIRNEDEYQLLSQRMDEIVGDDSNQSEIEKIDLLLTQFGTSTH